MSGGTQLSILNQKIDSYKKAYDELETAKKLPAGSGSSQAVSNAEQRKGQAWRQVDDAYTDYYTSMTNADQTPTSLDSLLRNRGARR